MCQQTSSSEVYSAFCWFVNEHEKAIRNVEWYTGNWNFSQANSNNQVPMYKYHPRLNNNYTTLRDNMLKKENRIGK